MHCFLTSFEMGDVSALFLIRIWMDHLLCYIFFNSISVISGRWEGDNARNPVCD